MIIARFGLSPVQRTSASRSPARRLVKGIGTANAFVTGRAKHLEQLRNRLGGVLVASNACNDSGESTSRLSRMTSVGVSFSADVAS